MAEKLLVAALAFLFLLVWLVRVVKWAWYLPEDSAWAHNSLFIAVALFAIMAYRASKNK